MLIIYFGPHCLSQHPSCDSSGVTFSQALRYWIRLGFINFGGPAGQIATMYRELVEERRWISETRFLHALNYCMLLPGPEAMQLATYIGWLLHRGIGGLAAGIFFVLPGAVLLWFLAWVYIAWGTIPLIAGLFYGIKPAVLAVVMDACWRVGNKTLRRPSSLLLAATAFSALYFLALPFPLVILGAGMIGVMGARFLPGQFVPPVASVTTSFSRVILDDQSSPPAHAALSWRRSMGVLVLWGSLWITPIILLAWWRGPDDLLTREAVFFSQAAMVTFGGAYAVLSYLAQQAVEHYAWLNAEQMVDGLGLAETTPGPLIMVTQFVGFIAAYQHITDMPPLLAGTLGALITTWCTFVPCFLWIFLGAPFIETLRGNKTLGAALSAITAAVAGVILNLALFFAEHTLWPKEQNFDAFAALVAVAAIAALSWRKWNMLTVIAASALIGISWTLLL